MSLCLGCSYSTILPPITWTKLGENIARKYLSKSAFNPGPWETKINSDLVYNMESAARFSYCLTSQPGVKPTSAELHHGSL